MVTVKSVIGMLEGYDPSDTLENLLQEPEFVSDLTESFKTLPKTSRAAASKIVRHRRPATKQKSRSDKALTAILGIESIHLPSKVHEKYGECQQCPSKFWVWAGIRLDLGTDSSKPTDAFLSEAYSGIRNLETQRQWDTISWRFFVLFFHDLVDCLGRKYLTSTLEDELVAILSSSSSITDNSETIRSNLKLWVAGGARYAQLSKSLGNGAPFLLPQSVTDKTWETGLPLGGSAYERAINHMVAKGFLEESQAIGADALGTRIRDAIMKPFRWNIAACKPKSTPDAPRTPRDCVVEGERGLQEPEDSHPTTSNQCTFEALATETPHDESDAAMKLLSRVALSPDGRTLTSYAFQTHQTVPSPPPWGHSGSHQANNKRTSSFPRSAMSTHLGRSHAEQQGLTGYTQRDLPQIQGEVASNNAPHPFDHIWQSSPAIPTTIQPLDPFDHIWETSTAIPPHAFECIWNESLPTDLSGSSSTGVL